MSLFTRWKRYVTSPGFAQLEYRHGQLARMIPAGTAYRSRPDAMYRSVDLRERLIPVAPQEVLTSDGVSVRVSMTLRLIVTDPARFVETADEPIMGVYLAAQVALREMCAQVDAETLMRRADIDVAPIRRAAIAAGASVGIEVQGVLIRDVILPGEIRAASVEVITARARGLAKLEQARAETAALRSLANVGRMLEQYPALAHLRLVQEMPHGSRVVLAVGDAEPTVD